MVFRLLGLGLLVLNFSVTKAQEIQVRATSLYRPSGFEANENLLKGDESFILSSGTYENIDQTLEKSLGPSFTRSGNAGGKSDLFLRGHEGHHTLVTLDGVILNDPSSPQRAYDFGHLSTLGIDQIKLYKGAQSSLFGGHALAGAVALESKDLIQVKGLEQNVFLGAGSQGRNQLAFESNYYDNQTGYSLLVEKKHEQGINLSLIDDGDKDGRDYLSGKVKFLKKISDHQLTLWGFASKDEVDLDNLEALANDPTTSFDDPNRMLVSKQYILSLSDEFKIKKNWQSKILYAFTQNERSDINTADSKNTGFFADSTYRFKGQNHQFQWAHDLDFLVSDIPTHLSSTLFYEKELAKDLNKFNKPVESADTRAINLKVNARKSLVEISLASRFNDHSYFGSHQDGQIEVMSYFNRDKTISRLKVASASSFPTLYQLTDSQYGNKNLRPEKAMNYEVGLVQKLPWQSKLEATYFLTRLEDRFSYDPQTFVSINQGRADIKGLELEASSKILNKIEIRGHYQQILTRNLEKNRPLLKRAKREYSLSLGQHFNDKISLFANYSYKGARDDYSAVLPSYKILNIYSTLEIFKQTNLTINVSNIFDRQYQETAGAKSPGRGYFASLNWKI